MFYNIYAGLAEGEGQGGFIPPPPPTFLEILKSQSQIPFESVSTLY